LLAGTALPLHAEDRWTTLPDPAPLPKADQAGMAPVNDIRMHFEIYHASGRDPVLLLHGGLGSTLDWGGQVPALAKHHCVIALDTRRQRRSTREAKAFPYPPMAADVVAMLDRLPVGKVAVVGWSDGGVVGLAMAIHYPDRVSRLLAYGANFNAAGFDTSIEH